MSLSFDHIKLLSGNTYYIEGLTNSGFKGGCLIDPGPDEEEIGALTVNEVLITHGHADHFSTAALLRRQGAVVFASREEVPLIENPEINIRGMFSWAKPSDEMVTKLFRGEGCRVDGYLDQWHDSGIQVIPLPGHTLGHVGFLTEDGVLFTGDALYLKDIWARHPLPYSIDTGLVRTSLDLIDTLSFGWLVPAHGKPIDKNESQLHVKHHKARLDDIDTLLIENLKEAQTTENIIAEISYQLGLAENPAQYWLSVTTIKGFLANLLQRKMIEFFVQEHAGCWRAV